MSAFRKWKEWVWVSLVGIFCIQAVSAAAAEPVAKRSFPIPDRGTLVMAVPESWKSELHQPPDKLPPTIRFSPRTAPRFDVLVTAIWSVKPGATFTEPQSVRKLVDGAAARSADQAVEKQLTVKELRGTSGAGYYFFATDKAPAPDEYKYMTQGAIAVGDLVVTFTILTNEVDSPVGQQALTMLGGATRGR